MTNVVELNPNGPWKRTCRACGDPILVYGNALPPADYVCVYCLDPRQNTYDERLKDAGLKETGDEIPEREPDQEPSDTPFPSHETAG